MSPQDERPARRRPGLVARYRGDSRRSPTRAALKTTIGEASCGVFLIGCDWPAPDRQWTLYEIETLAVGADANLVRRVGVLRAPMPGIKPYVPAELVGHTYGTESFFSLVRKGAAMDIRGIEGRSKRGRCTGSNGQQGSSGQEYLM